MPKDSAVLFISSGVAGVPFHKRFGVCAPFLQTSATGASPLPPRLSPVLEPRRADRPSRTPGRAS